MGTSSHERKKSKLSPRCPVQAQEMILKSELDHGLDQCQYPGCNIVLWFCKMLLLGETGQSIQGLSVLFLTNKC